jgi:tryptophan synthase alpha chain
MTRSASRLGPAFAALRGRTGLIPFLTAGFPSLDQTLEMARGLASLGCVALELGIPFSDPIADGPEIQRASERALRNGVTREAVLDLVRELRRATQMPVVLMTYANPVLVGGVESFARRAAEAGVDGVILSDVPPDESPALWAAFEDAGIDPVALVAPTTDAARLRMLAERSRGFIYCLARTGVTGAGAGESGDLTERIAAIRAVSPLPVAVGFGISNREAAHRLRGQADAIVVGAALMRAASLEGGADAAPRILALAGELSAALA